MSKFISIIIALILSGTAMTAETEWSRVAGGYVKHTSLPAEKKAACTKLLKEELGKLDGAFDVELLRPIDRRFHTIGCLDGWSALDSRLRNDEVLTVGVQVSVVERKLYLRVDNFALGTARALISALSLLKWKGEVDSVVIDLRGNIGGQLDELKILLDQLFSPEVGRTFMIIDTVSDWPRSQKTKSLGEFRGMPITILADAQSMSAAEWMIQVLRREWYPKTTRVVGARTGGKAVIQCLRPEGPITIKVTCGEWKNGRERVQDVGIEPDIPLSLSECLMDVTCIVRMATSARG